MQTVRHLADRARGAGAEIREGVEVVGFELGDDGVAAIATSEGRLACETVVVAPGPWIAGVWGMLGLEPRGRGRRASAGRSCPTGRRRRASSRSRGVGLGGAGPDAPVVHLDQSEPLRSDRDGRALVPRRVGHLLPHGPRRHHRRRAADPPDRPRARPVRLRRTPRTSPSRRSPSSSSPAWRPRCGASAGTPTSGDRPRAAASSPTRPTITPCATGSCANVYAIVDSGHGFKTLAIGRLAADDILDDGEPLLDAFRLAASRRAPRTRRRWALPVDLKRARRERLGHEEPGSVLRGPPITITCECGEKRDLRYGEAGRASAAASAGTRARSRPSSTTAIRRLQLRFRVCRSRSAWSSPRWRSSSR